MIKQIGDRLTTPELNGIISILRQFTQHHETIRIKPTVTSEYGTYEFDLKGSTVIDTGIVITNETLESQPRVKLTNPVFKNSTYTLKLTILHYTGVNVFDDNPRNYKVTETIELTLESDEYVDIPLESLDSDYVISFDSEINIKHNKPEIVEVDAPVLTVTSDKDILSYYDHDVAHITATVTYQDEPVVGEEVIFSIDDDDWYRTGTTDSNGECTVSYDSKGTGDLNIKCECPRIFVSKRYEVQDINYYDSQTVDKNRYTVSTGSASLSYSNKGLTVTGTATSTSTECLVLNNAITLPTNYIAEFTITDYDFTGTTTNKTYGGVMIDNVLIDFETGKGTVIYSALNYSQLATFPLISKGDTIKVEMNNGSMKFYINNVLKGTYSISRSGTVRVRTFRYRTLVMKDLKIIEL